MNFLKVLFLIIFCQITVVVANEYPVWYTNYKQSDKLFLYAIGDGSNIQEAEHKAIKNLTIYLTNNIVEIDIKIPKLNKEYYLENLKDLKTPYISEWAIEEKDILDNGSVVVLVNFRKKPILELYKTKFIDIDKEIEKLYELTLNNNIFFQIGLLEDISSYVEIQKQLEKIIKKIGNFKTSTYFDKYKDYQEQLKKLKQNLVLSIIYEDNDSFKYKNIVENKIKEKGAIIVPNSSNILFVKTEVARSLIDNKYETSIEIIFKLVDKDNKIIFYDSIMK